MTLVVLTGRPGAGKTTLVKKIVQRLKDKQKTVSGFFTEEVRQAGKRVGFDVVLLDGTRGPLARAGAQVENSEAGPCVGQYRVDVGSLESIVLPIFQQQLMKPVDIFVIDEVGKMELCSRKFEAAVRKLLLDSKTVFLATIPLPKGRAIGLVEQIRSSPGAQIYMVDNNNRNALEQTIMSQLGI